MVTRSDDPGLTREGYSRKEVLIPTLTEDGYCHCGASVLKDGKCTDPNCPHSRTPRPLPRHWSRSN